MAVHEAVPTSAIPLHRPPSHARIRGRARLRLGRGRVPVQGYRQVVGGEPYRIIIAANGYTPVAATVDETIEADIARSGLAPVKSTAALRPVVNPAGIVELILNRPTSGPVAWTISFNAP